MSYATPDNYKAYFTSRDAVSVTAARGKAEADDDRIAYHLNSASNRIDAWIGARYTLPLRDIPDALRDYCCDIARYLLTGTERTCTEEIRLRYEDAMSWLKQVANGKVSIGSNPENGGSVDSSSPDVAFYSGGEDLWSRDRTQGGCY
ncbi:gp436 family protein [Pantoea sp. BAV 3049]|uniref:gp436 family protein n=1 Tax=Pantoea sp. BAV 3049 TaxID=2654188 RepID=UPI00131D30F4|nr:phage protein Gp36 family protein [Pantoea sp. BAV 3049]